MENPTDSGAAASENLLPPHMAQIKISNMQKQIELAEQKARSATLQWTADKVKIKEMKEQHKKEIDDLTTRLTILERKARLQEQMQRDPNMLRGESTGTSGSAQNEDDNGNAVSKGQQSNGSKQLAQFDALQFENELTEKKLQIRNLSLQLSELRVEVATLNNKIDIVTKRNEELVKNDDRLSSQLEQFTRENQSLNATVEQSKQTMMNLESALANEKASFEKLRKEASEIEARQQNAINSMQAELEATKAQVKKLVSEREFLQSDIQAKQTEINRLTKENQKLMIEKQQEVRVQQQLLLALQHTAQEVKEYLNSFNSLEQKSQQSSQQILSSISLLNKKLVTLHTTIDGIMVEMQTKIQTSQRMLKEKEEELETIAEKSRAKQAQYESEIKELSQSLASAREEALQAELSWAQERQNFQEAQASAEVQIAQLEDEIRKEQAIPGTKYTIEEIESMKQDVRRETTEVLQLEFETIAEQRLTLQKETLQQEFQEKIEETVRDRLEEAISQAVQELSEAKEKEIQAKFEQEQAQLLQKVQDLQTTLELEQQKTIQLEERFQEQLQELVELREQNDQHLQAIEELEILNRNNEGSKSKPLSRMPTGNIDSSLIDDLNQNDSLEADQIIDSALGGQGGGAVSALGEGRDGNISSDALLLQELNMDAIKELILRSLITKNYYYNSDANSFVNSYPIDEDFLAELIQSFFTMNHKVYHIVQHSLDMMQRQHSSKVPFGHQDISSLVEDFLFTTAQEIILKLEKSKESALQQVKKDMREEMIEKVQETTKKQQEIKIQELFELREQCENESKKKDMEYNKKLRELESLVEELRHSSSGGDDSLDDTDKPPGIAKSSSSVSLVSKKLSTLRSNSLLFKSRPPNNAAFVSTRASVSSIISQESGENETEESQMWDNIQAQWRAELETEIRAQIYEEIMHKNKVHDNILETISGLDFDSEELTGVPVKNSSVDDSKKYSEEEFAKMREELLTGELSYIAEVRLENFDRLKHSRFGTDNIIALTILEHHIRYDSNPVDNTSQPSLTVQSLGGHSGAAAASEEQKQRQYRMQLKSLEIQRTMLLQHILEDASILDLYAFLHTTNRALTLLTTMTAWQSLVHYSQGGNFRDVLEVHRQVLLTCIRAAGGTKAGIKALGFIPPTSPTDMWPEPFRIIALEVFRGELVNEQKRLSSISNTVPLEAAIKDGNASTNPTKKPQKVSPAKPSSRESNRTQSKASSFNSYSSSESNDNEKGKDNNERDDDNEEVEDEGGNDDEDGDENDDGDEEDGSSAVNQKLKSKSKSKSALVRKKFPLTWSSKISSTSSTARTRRSNLPTKIRNASAPDLLYMLADQPALFGPNEDQKMKESTKEASKYKRFRGSLHSGVDYFIFRAWLGDKKCQQFLQSLHEGLNHWQENHNIQANTTFQELLHSLTSDSAEESKEETTSKPQEKTEHEDYLPVGIAILSQLIRLSLHSDVSFEAQEIFQKLHGFLFCLHQGKLSVLSSSHAEENGTAFDLSLSGFSGDKRRTTSAKELVIMHECAIQTDDQSEAALGNDFQLVRKRNLANSTLAGDVDATINVLDHTLPPGVICAKYDESTFEISEGLCLSKHQTLLVDIDLSLNPGKSFDELREILLYLPPNVRYCHWITDDYNNSEEFIDVRTRKLPDGLRFASSVLNLPTFLAHFPVFFPTTYSLRQGVNLLSGGSYCGHRFPYYHFDIPPVNKNAFGESSRNVGSGLHVSENMTHQSVMPGIILPPDILFLQCPTEWGPYPNSDLIPPGISPIKLSPEVAYNKSLFESCPLPPGHELVQLMFPCAYDIPAGVEISSGVKFTKLSTSYSLPSNIKVITRMNKTTPLPSFVRPLKLLPSVSSLFRVSQFNFSTSFKNDQLQQDEFALPWETNLECGVVTIMPKPSGIVFPLGMEIIRRTHNAMLPTGMQFVPPVEYPEGLQSLPDDCELVQLLPRYDFPPTCKISPAWYIFPRPTGVRLPPNHYLVYPDATLPEHEIPPLPSFACVMQMPNLPSGLVLPARTVTVVLLLSRFTQYCLPEGATLAPGVAVLNPKNIYKGALSDSTSSLVRRPPINILIVKRTPGTHLPPMVARGSRSDLPAGYLLEKNMDVVRVAVRFEVPVGVLLAPGALLGPNTQLAPGTILQSSVIRSSYNKSSGNYSEGVKVLERPYGLECAPGVELVTCPPEGCYLPFEFTPIQYAHNSAVDFPSPKLPPKSMLVKLPRNVKLLPAYLLAADMSVGLESMFEEHYSRPLPVGCLFASKKHRGASWPSECSPLPRSSLPNKLVSLLEDYSQGNPIGERKKEGKHLKPALSSPQISVVTSDAPKIGAEEISDRMNVEVVSLSPHYILPPGVELIAGVKVVAPPFFWSLPSHTVLVHLSDPRQNLVQLASLHIYPLDISPGNLLPPALRSFLISSKVPAVSEMDCEMDVVVKQLNSWFSFPDNYCIVQLPAVYDVYSWGEVLPGVQSVHWESSNPKFPLPPGHFFIERPKHEYSRELPPGFALGIHPTYASFRPPSSTSAQSAVFPPQIEIMHLVPRYFLPRNVTVLNTSVFTKQTFNTHSGGASTYSGPNGQEYVKKSFDPSWIVQLAPFEQVSATGCKLCWPPSALYEEVVFSSLMQLDAKLFLDSYGLIYFPMHPKENRGLHYPSNMTKHPQSDQIVSILFKSKIGGKSFRSQSTFLKCIGTLFDSCLAHSKNPKQNFSGFNIANDDDMIADLHGHPQNWFDDISSSFHVVKMSNGFPSPEERREYIIPTPGNAMNNSSNSTELINSNNTMKARQRSKVEVVYPILVNISTRNFHSSNIAAELNTFLADFFVFSWYLQPNEKQRIERLLKFRMKDHAVDQALLTVRKLESEQQLLHQELSSKESELQKLRKKCDELNGSYAILKEQCQKDEDYKGVIQKLKEQLAKQQQLLLSLQDSEKVSEPLSSSVLSNQEIFQLQEQLARSQQQQQVLISQLTDYENQIKELSNKQYQDVVKERIVKNLQDKLHIHLSSLKDLVMTLFLSFSKEFHRIIYDQFHLTEIQLFELLQEAERLQESQSGQHDLAHQVDDEISLITTEGEHVQIVENDAKMLQQSVSSSSDKVTSVNGRKTSATVSKIHHAIRHGPYYSSTYDNVNSSAILDPVMSSVGDNNSVFSAISSQSTPSLSHTAPNYLPRDLTRDVLGKKLRISEDFPLDVASLYSHNTSGSASKKNSYMAIAKPIVPMAASSSINPTQPYPVTALPRGVGDLLSSRRKKLTEEAGIPGPISKSCNDSSTIVTVEEVQKELEQLGDILHEAMQVIVTNSAYTSGLQPSCGFETAAGFSSLDDVPGNSGFAPESCINSNTLVKSIDWKQLSAAFDQVLQKLLLFSTLSISRFRQTHDYLLQRMEFENTQLHKAYHSLGVHDSFVCSLIYPQPTVAGGGSVAHSMTYSSTGSTVSASSSNVVNENVLQLQERLFRTEQQYQEAVQSVLKSNTQPLQDHISQYMLLHEQRITYQFHIMLLKQTLQQDESAVLLLGGSGMTRSSLSLPLSLPHSDSGGKKVKGREPTRSSLAENLMSRTWEESLIQKREDSQLLKALTYRISKVQDKLFWLQEKEKFVKQELQKILGIIHDLMEKSMSEIQGIVPAQLMNALLHYKQSFYEKLKFQPRNGTVLPEFNLESNPSMPSSHSTHSSHSLSANFPTKPKLGSIGSLPPASTFSHLTLKRTDALLPKKTFSKLL